MSSKKVPAGGVFFAGWKEIATPCGLAMTGKAQEIATPCGLAMTEATILLPHGVAPTGNIAGAFDGGREQAPALFLHVPFAEAEDSADVVAGNVDTWD